MSRPSLPIVCAWCERVRTPAGRFEPMEGPAPDAATHGICQDCLAAQKREASASAAVACP